MPLTGTPEFSAAKIADQLEGLVDMERGFRVLKIDLLVA